MNELQKIRGTRISQSVSALILSVKVKQALPSLSLPSLVFPADKYVIRMSL